MAIFTVAVRATCKGRDTLLTGSIRARSKQHAEALAGEAAYRFFPESRGFSGHQFVADEFRPVTNFTHWEAA